MASDQVLGELMRTRRSALLAYAYLFALDRAEAEDLVQEGLVRTFGRRRSLLDVPSAEAYVRRSIRTAYLDQARRGVRWTARLHLVADSGRPPSPDDTAVAGVDVRAALAELPPRERTCVVLRHMDDLTVTDIAGELGLSEGAVKRYLSDATRTLRASLGPEVAIPSDPDAGVSTLAVRTATERSQP